MPAISPLDTLADVGRSREGDLVDVGVVHQRGARRSRTGDDVDDAGRELGLFDDLGEKERGQRRGLRRLEDAGVPGGESGSELPRRHEEREVPRNDLAGDAERAGILTGERVGELVGPTRVVKEVRRREGNVDVARLLDGFSAVHRLHDGELARLLLNGASDAIDVLAALQWAHLRPNLVVGRARRFDREIDVLLVGESDLGERPPRSTARWSREVFLGARPPRHAPPMKSS